jgi:hypothetical protein
MAQIARRYNAGLVDWLERSVPPRVVSLMPPRLIWLLPCSQGTKPKGMINLRDVKVLHAQSSDPTAPSTAIELGDGMKHNFTLAFTSHETRDAFLRVWVNVVPVEAVSSEFRAHFYDASVASAISKLLGGGRILEYGQEFLSTGLGSVWPSTSSCGSECKDSAPGSTFDPASASACSTPSSMHRAANSGFVTTRLPLRNPLKSPDLSSDDERAGAEEHPAGRESERPAGRKSERPAGRKSERPAGRESERPAGRQSERPAGRKSERPAGRESKRPAGRESERPAGRESERAAASREGSLGSSPPPSPRGKADGARLAGLFATPASGARGAALTPDISSVMGDSAAIANVAAGLASFVGCASSSSRSPSASLLPTPHSISLHKKKRRTPLGMVITHDARPTVLAVTENSVRYFCTFRTSILRYPLQRCNSRCAPSSVPPPLARWLWPSYLCTFCTPFALL